LAIIIVGPIIVKHRGLEINYLADMIPSLSFCITNTIRDGMKFRFVIISYS